MGTFKFIYLFIFSMRTFILLVALLFCAIAVNAQKTFTGVVQNDFSRDSERVKIVEDLSRSGQLQKDVGLPTALTEAGFTTSGWDVEYVAFEFDDVNDEFHIGIKCYVVCGDADGDGDSGGTSAALAGLGGNDFPGFAQSESMLIALDLGGGAGGAPDGLLDFIVGYPAGEAFDSEPFPAPCSNVLLDTECFGLYLYSGSSYAQPQYRFKWQTGNNVLGASPRSNARDNNPSTDTTRPHLEWTIVGFNALRARAGYPQVSNTIFWSFNMLVFTGSFDDDGVGEDFLPANAVTRVEFPCLIFDECDVCGGDGSTCLDCANVPNGPNVYDVCDVCGGNGQSCLDCAGVPNGPATYDVCGVCNGNGLSCLDCAGVPFGTSTYDACDVCGGDGSSCVDCAGVPFGTTSYDLCGVCGGDSRSCLDCRGVPNGAAAYDVCGVCRGDGTSCLDCAGVPFGTSTYARGGVRAPQRWHKRHVDARRRR